VVVAAGGARWAVLANFIRDYETNWLDELIPALDGHTPRQAADDPTRLRTALGLR
jgi:hypothetical protein